MRRTRLLTLILATAAPVRLAAQHPLERPADAIEVRYSRAQPVLSYRLRVDSTDLSGFAIELRIRNARDTFHLAMAAHQEYDDRYWRYVEAVGIESGAGPATITRSDSVLWAVHAPGGEAVIRYRIQLPVQTEVRRSAWKPFLAPTGGLVGGPQSFMYVVGAELSPSHITVDLPPSWEVATGLTPTSDPRTFFAPSVAVLMESPLLVGRFRSWRFAVDGVPHRIVYWPLPDAASFDTVALVRGVEQIIRQAVALFGRAPWREYTFLAQDGAVGSLEHFNSVSLGAASVFLHEDLGGFFAETAHEFFHTWNLMRIRPAEYGWVSYRTQPPTSGLWWSEGLTIFYADLLRRRAGLSAFEPTRTAHLAGLIARYLGSPGNTRFSAEAVSRVAYNASPGALGDFDASTHVQGEILGSMLDLVIRDATRGRRSMDDVMRAMLGQFGGRRGFTGKDIERTIATVCGCSVTPFFAAHVRGAAPVDFDRYLGLIGLRARVAWTAALDGQGHPAPDLRLRAWQPADGRSGLLSLLIGNPASGWGRAGLHTGDRLVALNDAPVTTVPDFRTILNRLGIGDTVRVDVERAAGRARVTVVVAGYVRPGVTFEEVPGATGRARALRDAWLAGRP